MIRDPSDGSVRENLRREMDSRAASPQNQNPMPALEQASGLPIGSKNPEQIARLERSRTWLKEYHKPKSEGQNDGTTRNSDH